MRIGAATTLLALLAAACGGGAPRPGRAPLVRVLLREASSRPSVRVRTAGPYRLRDLRQGTLLESGAALSREFGARGATLARALRFACSGGFTLDETRYPGDLLLVPGEGGVQLVNETDLESYLAGVLAHEMGAAFPPAALRAQAVASRTYALHAVETAPPDRPWQVADDTSSQVYTGRSGLAPPLLAAVRDTAGMVLLADDRPLEAFFHSTCGGHTADSGDVFGGATPLPLTGAPCPFCRTSRLHRWSASFPVSEVATLLGLPRPPAAARVESRDASGRAGRIVFTCGGDVLRSAAAVRAALGPARLLSTRILSLSVRGGELLVEGAGWGHGVGMCQMGAAGMARLGAGAGDVLAQYYPGANLVRIY